MDYVYCKIFVNKLGVIYQQTNSNGESDIRPWDPSDIKIFDDFVDKNTIPNIIDNFHKDKTEFNDHPFYVHCKHEAKIANIESYLQENFKGFYRG